MTHKVDNKVSRLQRVVVYLIVKVETSDQWCPSGSVLVLIPFSTFVSGTDSRIECTLSNYNTRPGGMLDTGREGMPSRETLTGWEDGQCKTHEIRQSQVQVPIPKYGNPRHTNRLGGEVVESSPVERSRG